MSEITQYYIRRSKELALVLYCDLTESGIISQYYLKEAQKLHLLHNAVVYEILLKQRISYEC